MAVGQKNVGAAIFLAKNRLGYKDDPVAPGTGNFLNDFASIMRMAKGGGTPVGSDPLDQCEGAGGGEVLPDQKPNSRTH
jgi:hypothetical protein